MLYGGSFLNFEKSVGRGDGAPGEIENQMFENLHSASIQKICVTPLSQVSVGRCVDLKRRDIDPEEQQLKPTETKVKLLGSAIINKGTA
jgi:hypothetical protein